MNKTQFIKEIEKKTNLSSNDSILVNDILENNGIFGRKNKEKIISALMEKLNMKEEKAEEIYNTVCSIATTEIKNKIKHPFRSQD